MENNITPKNNDNNKYRVGGGGVEIKTVTPA